MRRRRPQHLPRPMGPGMLGAMMQRLGWFVFLLLLLLARPAAAESARLRIVMVLDASGSMAQNDPQRLVRVASKMLAELTDDRDHITVLSFGSEVKTLAEGSGAEHGRIRDAISTLGRIESCTDYALALEAAASALPPIEAGERRVVVFLTDGRFEPVSEHGCGRFEGAPTADKAPILERIKRATERFQAAGARVFTVALGAAPSRAADSAAVLREVAKATEGRFLEAHDARDVPPIFARIFGALVGAPVTQYTLDPGRTSVELKVPKGARQLHVVLVPEATRNLNNATLLRGDSPVPFEQARVETPSSGYRLARLDGDADGSYRLTVPDARRMAVLVIPDVGLSLHIEGIPDTLPADETLAAVLALRTRAGAPVALSPEFLRHVVFTVEMNGTKLFDQAPNSTGEARFSSQGKMRRGDYHIVASAKHAQGFLDIPAVDKSFKVEPRFTMQLKTAALRFDTMAEEVDVVPLDEPVTIELVAPEGMPAPITLQLQPPQDPRFGEIFRIEPTVVTFGPGMPRKLQLLLQYNRPPRELRGFDHHFTGELSLVPLPEHAQLLTGETHWTIPVDGRLRPWTLVRYLKEYQWQLTIGALILLLLIWFLGRMVAHKFPAKARIHYQEIGQQFASESLIKRYARHGAFRAAKFKFPLGRKARPKVWFRATGGLFEVVPDGGAVTVVDETLAEQERSRSKAFRGSWEQRYRIGDDYEIWLTRH